MSLYASLMDLGNAADGIPSAALAPLSNGDAVKLRALRQASAKADSYLRTQYALPLRATVEEEATWVAATGSTATAIGTPALIEGSEPTQAWGVQIEVLTTGALGVATGRASYDNGTTWGSSFTITASAISLTRAGITVTFSDDDGGGFFDGDFYWIPVGFKDLTSYVVDLAVYRLMRGRGFNPDGEARDPLRDAHKDAIKWLESVRDGKVDLGLVDASSKKEDGFRFAPSTAGEGDRRWDEVMGRESRSTASSRSWDPYRGLG